jgi:tetratricopeptide (TPR) repeat protein
MSKWFWERLNWLAGGALVACLFGMVVFAANIEIKDVDLWLHLAVGKYIAQSFSIPKVDFLSCTIAGTPWVNHEWLFQAVVYSAYALSGIEGLVGLQVVVVVLTFALLLSLGYIRGRALGPTVILLLVLLVYQLRMTLRPDMFSLLFLSFYIAILGGHLERRWSLWAVVLVQILWVNTHGFFIFGPVVILIHIMAEGIKRHVPLAYEWNTVGRLSDEEYRRLKWILAAAVAACLVNPHFIKGAWYPVGVLFSLGGESKFFFTQIQELQSTLSWDTLFSWQPYAPYKLLIVISFFSFVLNYRKIDVNAVLLWVISLIFSLTALRNIVFFAFAAYFVFLANFQYMSLRKFWPVFGRNAALGFILSIAGSVILILWMGNYAGGLLLNGYYDFDKFERKMEYGGVSLRNFPYKAADFLVANKIKGNFFNDFNSGAYLLGRASPDIKVFIDGRTEVYGAEFYKMYDKIWEGDKALFDEAADRYHLTGAFLNSVYVPAPSKTVRHLYENKEWVLVYFDYDAAIFLRDIPENRPWIDRFRLDLARWEAPDADLLKIGVHKVTPYRHINRAYALYNMGFPDKALMEAAQALRVEPYNDKAYKIIGKIYNERGRFAEAFENLRKAKLIAPEDIKVRYQIAVALYHLGEVEKARAQCRLVLTARPDDAEALFLLSLIYTKEHDYDKAMGLLNKAREKSPDNMEGLLKVGALLVEQGEYRAAKSVYAMVIEKDLDNADAREGLNVLAEREDHR